MIYGYVYKFTNLINGKYYIGKHKYSKEELDINYWGSGRIWLNVLNSVTKDNISREILEYCYSLEQLNLREQYWIGYLNSTDDNIGYNISSGGDGGDITSAFTWYNNGEKEFYILKSEEDKFKNLNKGRLNKNIFGGTQKGFIWINNGIEQHHINPKDLDKYPGWVFGMLDRGDEWRSKLGKYIHTPEITAKANATRAQTYKEHPERMSSTIWKPGQKAHNKGKKSITNGVKNKYITLDEYPHWEQQGWYWGNTQNHKKH